MGLRRTVVMGRFRRRAQAWVLWVLLTGAVVVGCGSPGRSVGSANFRTCASLWSRTKSSGLRTPTPGWLLNARELPRLLAAGLPRSLLMAYFNRPGTVLIINHGRPRSLLPRATLGFDFTSARSLISALKHGRVSRDVRYLILDLEHWPLTPTDEQRNPMAALRKAVTAAHAAGKCVMFTPGLDLVSAMRPGWADPAYSLFDHLVASPGAAVSDAFEVQAQHTEGTYRAGSLVPGAIAAARTARHGEPVFVGLSTNPNGRHVTPAELLSLYEIGRASGATGYWLNIPRRGTECPACGAPQPGVAVAFLKALARRSS